MEIFTSASDKTVEHFVQNCWAKHSPPTSGSLDAEVKDSKKIALLLLVAAVFLLPAVALGHTASNGGGSDHAKSKGNPDSDKNQVTDHEDCDHDDQAQHSPDHDCGKSHKPTSA